MVESAPKNIEITKLKLLSNKTAEKIFRLKGAVESISKGNNIIKISIINAAARSMGSAK